MASITKDIGHSGLETRFGRPNDDFLLEWRGREKVKRIDEMVKNSPVIGALRLAIEMPIRNIDWQFTSEEGPDDPRLELLTAARKNLSHSWNDHVTAALLFPFYGWSMFTITYERVGGQVLWRKFKELGQDTVHEWAWDEDGGLAGLKQLPWLAPELIPIERMILYRFRYNRNNPEGESILRPAWIPYYYVKNLQQVEGIGIERNLNGLPVITPPMGADMTETTSETSDWGKATAIVRNIRNDEQAGVVLPPPTGEGEHYKWNLALLSGGGMSKVIDTDIPINRYEKRILMSALAQFLILGQDKVGALSLSVDQTSFFGTALNATADIIAETFTKFAIPRLMRLNGLEAEGLRLEHSKAGDLDLATLADVLQKLSPNITWTVDDEIWLRSILVMPEKSAEELEEERAAEQERQAALLPAGPTGFPARPGDRGEAVERNAAVTFAVSRGLPPDNEQRMRDEGEWEREMSGYFAGLRKRVKQWARSQAQAG